MRACPLCGSSSFQKNVDEFIVCDGCGEMLRQDELVRWSNWFTRRRYNRANGKDRDYR